MASKQKTTKTTAIYQLKISLRHIKPPIWRRVQVFNSITLEELHWIIQIVMGWEDYHLHQFTINGVEYGMPQPEYEFDVEDEGEVQLKQVVTGENFKFHYTYDFGDSWDHEILIEKILPPDKEGIYPICIKGKRACPPEDCGGPYGYPDFLEALQNPSHPEHETMAEWMEGSDFDPEMCDIKDINERLANLQEE